MGMAWRTGVCLRQHRLEWTVLRRAKESWEVHDHGEADLGPDPVSGEPAPLDLAVALKPYMKRFKGRLSVALPSEQVLLRAALLPSTDPGELRGMAELQTDKYSPFPVEAMALGAEVVEATETSSLVVMAAVRRDTVDESGRIFQEAGALPDVVDVEALAWWWTLKAADRVPAHGSQIFIRVTTTAVDLIMSRDGEPLLFRALPPRPGEDGALREWVADCAEETGYSMTSLETEWGGTGAPSVHIYHPPTLAMEWAGDLLAALGLEILFTHPLADLAPLSEGVAHRLAHRATPLAMDLAPDAWRDADAARSLRRRMLRAATAFLVVWLLALGIFITLLNLNRGRLARLRAEVEAVEGPALEVRRLRAKVLEFTQYADRTHSALESLRVVSELLPPGVDLTSFIYRKGSTLALRGEADDANKVYALISSLEGTDLFPEVRPEGVSTRNTPQGPRNQFGVTIRLPGVGEGAP